MAGIDIAVAQFAEAAVAQHAGAGGAALLRGIAAGNEIQIDLARAISLHRHKIDHVAHLGPSAAAGIGALLGLSPEVIYQAIGQALHTTTATRQSRKGAISTWKASAPPSPAKWRSRRSTGRCAVRPRPRRSGGRGRRDRLASRRPGGALRSAAARARRGQALDAGEGDGISQSGLWQIVHRKTTPSRGTIERLAQLEGASVESILASPRDHAAQLAREAHRPPSAPSLLGLTWVVGRRRRLSVVGGGERITQRVQS